MSLAEVLEPTSDETGDLVAAPCGPVPARPEASRARHRLAVAVGAAAVVGLVAAGWSQPGRRLVRYIVACARSFRRPPAPRRLGWIEVKRSNSRLFDAYGHWWVELDGVESYGWWPAAGVGLRMFLLGGAGRMNGVGGRWAGGSATRDPHHGDRADHTFHPILTVRTSDWQVRRDIRAFVEGFDGGWRWSLRRPSANCRSFQLALFHAVGLAEGPEDLATRGRGCPGLRGWRWARCALRRLRRRQLVRHHLGGPCGCPPLRVPPATV
ncbi:MAG: hypothetical protein ACRDZS_08365 [Acidimicrobiales bacterium]